jgi:WD40 repeat protein
MIKKIIVWVIVCVCWTSVTSVQAQVLYSNYVEWSPVGDYLAVSTGSDATQQSITIYDANTLALVNQLLVSSEVKTFKWNRTGTQIVFSTLDRKILVWNNPISSQQVFEMQNIYADRTEPISPPSDFAWSPDDTQLAGVVIGVTMIWNMSTKNITQRITGDYGELFSIAWSSITNKVAITTGDSKIIILNGDTWEVEKTFYLTPDKVQAFHDVDFNSSGTAVVTGRSDDVIYVWEFAQSPEEFSFNDIDYARQISDIKPSYSYITSIDWSPNNLLVASGDIDGKIEIRDANNGDLLQTITVGEFGTEVPLSWSPDGTRLAYIPSLGINILPSVIVPDIDPSYLIPVTPTPSGPTATPDVRPCVLTTLQPVNLRSGPGGSYEQLGSRLANDTLYADAQATDNEGFIWWRLFNAGIDSGLWVRQDLVSEDGNCTGLLDLTGQPVYTPTPTP